MSISIIHISMAKEINQHQKTIIVSSQQGNHSSFEKLVHQWERPIFAYIFKMVSKREDTEDLVQETFYKTYRGLTKYDVNRPFSTWIFTIAQRTVYDWLRRKRHHQELFIIDDPEHPYETPDPKLTYKTIESKYDVATALKRLNPKYKRVIDLYYLKQQTYQEISKKMAVSPNTVKTYLRRARLRLRKYLI